MKRNTAIATNVHINTGHVAPEFTGELPHTPPTCLPSTLPFDTTSKVDTTVIHPKIAKRSNSAKLDVIKDEPLYLSPASLMSLVTTLQSTVSFLQAENVRLTSIIVSLQTAQPVTVLPMGDILPKTEAVTLDKAERIKLVSDLMRYFKTSADNKRAKNGKIYPGGYYFPSIVAQNLGYYALTPGKKLTAKDETLISVLNEYETQKTR